MGHFRYVGDPVEERFDCCVKNSNDIDIDQNATATGGNGGNGGNNNSAAAAAASGGGVAVAVPVSVNVEEDNWVLPERSPNSKRGESVEESEGSNLTGGIEVEAEANAGNGGNGGDAKIDQIAVADIDNCIHVICKDGKKKRVCKLKS